MARGLVPRGHLWQGDYHAVHSARLVMTRTADAFHRNDKVLGQGTCLQSDMTEHLQQLFRSIGNHYQHRKLHCHLFGDQFIKNLNFLYSQIRHLPHILHEHNMCLLI